MTTRVESVPALAIPETSTPASRRRRTTPARLRLARWLVVVLTVAGAILGIVAIASRQAATASVQATTNGTLIDAQTVYSSLSSADTDAAGAYLSRGADVSDLDAQYQADLARATNSLARLAALPDATPEEAEHIQTLITNIPVYAGLVETAQVNNEQGHPVGAAYLAEANNHLRRVILPSAEALHTAAKARLSADYETASRSSLSALFAALLVVDILALIAVQVWLSIRFRRTFNVPLVVATVLLVVAIAWTAVALAMQRSEVLAAQRDGTTRIEALTQARIVSQRLRADDELTLVTRDAIPTYQLDYQGGAPQLHDLLEGGEAHDSPPFDRAIAAFADYETVHGQIREFDAGQGDPKSAIALNSGSGPSDAPALAKTLDESLTTELDTSRASFTTTSDGAGNRLRGLGIVVFLVAAVSVLFVLIGTDRRLAEYR
jgi:hypothetical protein